MKKISIHEINQAVGGTLVGSPTVEITGVEEIAKAKADQLTFIGEKKYANLWKQSKAPAAIVNDSLDIVPGEGRAFVRVADADLAVAVVLQMFAPPPPAIEPGIHPTAVLAPTATIGEGAAVGAGCYIGARVEIGADVILYPNVTVLDESRIGKNTVIWPGTVIRERCRIGNDCILHPNVTVGADGFGYRPSPDGRGLVKIPQIGTVWIGNGVEIGAGTCVDRGKFSATSIGDGTKIDNLVQIGHNCTLGRSCAVSGQTGLAGSATLEDGVLVGGGARIADHVTVGAGARIGGATGVISDVAPGKTLLGTPADDHRQTLRLWAAQKHLPDLVKQLKKKTSEPM
jgi:UDP-3-O-[3-hydroxymyristoyl] glucosamine N-acyltransferase